MIKRQIIVNTEEEVYEFQAKIPREVTHMDAHNENLFNQIYSFEETEFWVILNLMSDMVRRYEQRKDLVE